MADLTLTGPYFETFAMDEDHPTGGVGFICSTCRRDVSTDPCPDHAPVEVPGLALVECEKTPRHWAWVLASDANGYGIPCWQCITEEDSAQRRAAEDARHGHWSRRWRYWPVAQWTARRARSLGVIGGYGLALEDRGWRLFGVRLKGRRDYILGAPRETWHCWLIGHHRRGEQVGPGFCGKCVPWPCCGSIRVEHQPGCRDNA